MIRKLSIFFLLASVFMAPALHGQPSLGSNSTISINSGHVSFTCGTQLNPNGSNISIGPNGHYAAVKTQCVLLADGNRVAFFTCNQLSGCPPAAPVPVIPGAKYVTIANHYFVLQPSGHGDWIDPFAFLTPFSISNSNCVPNASQPLDLTPVSPVLPSPLPPPTCLTQALLSVAPPPDSASVSTFPFVAEITSASINPISITPTEAILGPKQQQVFTSVSNATWTINPPSVGTINPPPGVPATTATYTAPTPIDSAQDVTLTACSVDVPGNCTTVKISLVPSVVTITPNSISLLPGASTKFTATITGAPNIDQTVIWSFDPDSPSTLGKIDAGTYSATPKEAIQAPTTVLIKAASKDDPSKFANASIFTGPVSITVTGDTDLLAAPGAQTTYTANVVSPTTSALTWTPIAPPALGTITPITSSTAQFAIGTAPTTVTTTKIEACLTEDKSFCGALNPALTLSPQATIAKVDPAVWPSGQQTGVTITGNGFGAIEPTVTVSDAIGFDVTGFTFNTTVQGNVNPPIIPLQKIVTVTVRTASNPITSEAKTSVTIAPPTVTMTLFPTAATLLKGQQITFTPTITCKLANGSSCNLPPPAGNLVTCSINSTAGTVNLGPAPSCTYVASTTIIGQPVVVQLTVRTLFNPLISATATITLTPLNVTVTPATQDVNGGGSQKFTAAVTGAPSDSNGVIWSLPPTDPPPVGTLDQTGLYTAPNPVVAAQKVTIKACSVLDTTNACGTAQVNLVPISVTVTPPSVNLPPNGTQQFFSTVLGSANSGVTWSITPPNVGTITAGGLYTAPSAISTAQQVTVKACTVVTPTPPNPCGTAVVNLLVVPDFSVSATPASQTVNPGGSAVYNMTATPINGFTGTVSFNCSVTPSTTTVTVSGCPISISLASNPVSFPVTVNTASSTTLQNYTITATGTAGLLSHSSTLTLSVAGPIPVFSPTALSFPDQNINTSSAPASVTLTNSGNAPLLITGSSITGAGSNFVLTNNCPPSLAANISCTFTVIFAPTAVGQFSGMLALNDNAPGIPHSVSLSGKGATPGTVFSATTLVFAPQIVGTSSTSQSVTLTNAGTTPISGISTGSGFPQINNCGTSLPVGASCTITVTFAPVVGGLNLGSISVTGSTTVVNLSGSGIPTLTNLSPASVTAGSSNFTLGLTGSGFTRTALVRINGTTRPSFPIDLHNLSVAITSSDVANIGSLNVSVVIPGTGGQESGTLPLSITNTPIPLIGNIVPARVIAGYQLPLKLIVNGSFFTSNSKVRLNGVERPTTFISPNQLTAILSASDFIAGAFPAITVVNSPASVPANTATLAVFRYGDLSLDNTISVTDLITLSNFLAGNITLADPAPGDLNLDGKTDISDLTILANFLAGNTHSLPIITGAVLFNAGATVNLSPPTFAGQTVGTTSDPLTLQLINGGTPLAINGFNISPTGEFSVQSNNCGLSLAANASCIINVTFSPTAAGARTATLTVLDSAGNSPQTAILSGTGIGSAAAPTATLSSSLGITDGPATLTFSQAVGTDSAARTLTLTNNGPTALSISGIHIVPNGIAPSGEFAENDNCGTSLAANTSCIINVTFSPVASGTRIATLTVTDNASNSPQTANLIGTGP